MKYFKQILWTIPLFIMFIAYALFSEPSGIPVLNYHQINNRDENSLTVSSEQFAAQMDYLKDSGYHTITADELYAALHGKGKLPEKPVLITLDDGYLDNYTIAYPILKERGMHAMIFIITDFVDRYPNYLTWQEILEMQENNIEFGSHTLSHPVLTNLSSDAEIIHQLKNSKHALEWRLGKPIYYLAYPGGYISESIKNTAQSVGYRAAFTVDFGRVHFEDDPYALRRIPIFGANSHTLFRFKARLRVPKLAAFLESCQKGLVKSGHPALANLFPTF